MKTPGSACPPRPELGRSSEQRKQEAQGVGAPTTPEEASRAEARALRNYEQFHDLPGGAASLDQVENSSAGVGGWARAGIPTTPQTGEAPCSRAPQEPKDGGPPGAEKAHNPGSTPPGGREPQEAAPKDEAGEGAGESPAPAAGRCGPAGCPRAPTPEPPVSAVRQMD